MYDGKPRSKVVVFFYYVTAMGVANSMEGEKVYGSPLSFLSQLRYRHLVAGVAGGVTSTLLTHPFDLIKLRLAG